MAQFDRWNQSEPWDRGCTQLDVPVLSLHLSPSLQVQVGSLYLWYKLLNMICRVYFGPWPINRGMQELGGVGVNMVLDVRHLINLSYY